MPNAAATATSRPSPLTVTAHPSGGYTVSGDAITATAAPRVEVLHRSEWSSGARVTSTQRVTVTTPDATAATIVRYWHFPDGRLSHIDSLPA